MTHRGPLPEIDKEAVAEFVRDYRDSIDEPPPDTPPVAEYFGDHVAMADELLELVLAGVKRATAGSLAEYEVAGEPIPEVGALWVACDGRGMPGALLRTTEIRVGPLDSVDAQFAWDEGEGDRTLDWWLSAHTEYYERRFAELGLEFSRDIAVAFERFELVHPI